MYKSEHNEMWTSDRATPYPCVSPLNHNFKDLVEYEEGVDYKVENVHRQVIVDGHLEWLTQLTVIPIHPLVKEIESALHLFPEDKTPYERGLYDGYINCKELIEKYTPEPDFGEPIGSEIQSIEPPPEKYGWVKASDRNPTKKGVYKVRALNNKKNPVEDEIWWTGRNLSNGWLCREGCEVLEWFNRTELNIKI